jgi:diguanylate cyclase (GGDEF)-like protein/PAS domain S-box-containing protein
MNSQANILHVLYIEDSLSDADLTKRAFASIAPNINLQIFSTVQAGFSQLTNPNSFDVLLTDLSLPDGSGLELLTYVRTQSLPLTVIILTGSGDQESATAAIKAGADDYVVKRSDYLEHLPNTIRAAFERFHNLFEFRSRGLRVLYAEHNLSDIDLMRRHINLHNPQICLSIASDAETVLAKLTNSSPTPFDFDVLLLDFRLPSMDGLELTKIIRQERNLDFPIVFITGQGSEDIAAQALHLGVDDYITKHEGYLFEVVAILEKVKRQADLKRERTALKAINHRLNHLLATSPCILFCFQFNHGVMTPVWVSQNIESMLGYTQEEALAHDWWASHVYADDRSKLLTYPSMILNDTCITQEYRFQHKNGRIVWVQDQISLVRNKKGQTIEVMGTWLDLTVNKRSEAVQLARNVALEQIIANRSLPTILDEIARRLETINPEMLVSILLFDHHSGLLHNGAAPSLPAFFINAVEGIKVGNGVGSCGTAAWLGEPFIVSDIDHHPFWESFLPLTQQADLHACWSVPFKDESGTVLGTFGIYARQPSTPECSDLELVKEFALIAALAITKLRSTEALRQSAAVFESTRDGVMITDLTPRIVAINPAFTEITGYNESEILGCNPSQLKSGRHGMSFYQAMWSAIAEIGHWQGEIWNRRKNGEVYPQWLTISSVFDEQGTVNNYAAVFTDISQIKQSEARLEHLAHFDPLTYLPNRLLLQYRLAHALEQADRHGSRVAVLYIDLDRFKTVNDSLGHPAGDELLLALAKRLTTRLREEDSLGRLGGDEFLLILENIHEPESAAVVAQNLFDLLAMPFNLPCGHEVFIGASIGISLFPDDGKTVTELIQYSDLAMYHAKQEGRNTYRFHTEALTRAANEKLALETSLRHAIDRNEFILHYQPLVNSHTGQIIGAEALVRWQPAGQNLVSPAKFIPIAEETGLIVPLGEWVLRTACIQATSWIQAGFPPLLIAVNMSVRQFQSGNIVNLVANILNETGLPAQLLELELTESIIMEQAEKSISTLDELKALGVRLAIDDFGTGYSSLAYLKRFPIDKLKIDQSFVQALTDEGNDNTIVATIIAMAKSLKLDLIAEGVETDQQLSLLKQLGCDLCQGYLFSKPIPADEFKQLLQR